MLQGQYDIKLDSKMKYNDKIVKMANEPVAFHLYKMRHFEPLKNTKGSFGPTDSLLNYIDAERLTQKTANSSKTLEKKDFRF